MTKLSWLFLAIAALGSTGCQDKKPAREPERTNTIRVETPEEAENLFRTFTVECKDPEACNPSVALLMARESPTSMNVCTASLVGSDYMFTNKHCLPTDIMYAGASCRDRVLFKFPKTHSHEEVWSDCDSVIEVSSYDVTQEARQQVDYAFVKLRWPAQRPVLEFDPRGVEEGEILKVTRMSPDTDLRKGIISDIKCKAVQNTIVTPLYDSRFSPIIHVNDCPIVHGNSGSSMFGSDGKIRAIVQQGKGNPDAEPLITKTFARGTNAACIRFAPAGLSGPLDPVCHRDLSDQAATDAFNRLWDKRVRYDEQKAELEKKIKNWVRSAPKIVQWTTESETVSEPAGYSNLSGGILMETRLVPKCISRFDVRRKDSWIAAYRADRSNVSSGFMSTAHIDLKIVRWILRWDLDGDLRIRPRIEEQVMKGAMIFSPRNIVKSGTGDFSLHAHGSSGIVVAKAEHIPLCTTK